MSQMSEISIWVPTGLTCEGRVYECFCRGAQIHRAHVVDAATPMMLNATPTRMCPIALASARPRVNIHGQQVLSRRDEVFFDSVGIGPVCCGLEDALTSCADRWTTRGRLERGISCSYCSTPLATHDLDEEWANCGNAKGPQRFTVLEAVGKRVLRRFASGRARALDSSHFSSCFLRRCSPNARCTTRHFLVIK